MVLSLKKPVATKDNLVPCAMVRREGVTEMDTMLALVTYSVVDALIEASVAVMVVVPGVRPFAKPLLPIVATVALEEAQETFPLTL